MNQSPGRESDEELISAFQMDRSEKNFVKIYRKHSAALYRLAMHLCYYNTMTAADTLQETWLTIAHQPESFAGRSSFKTWITGILINKCRERLRSDGRRNGESILPTQHPTILPDSSGMDLQSALGQLSPGYREVLVLHDSEGYKHHEIALLLGISEGTSKSQLFHARVQVRKFLTEKV